MDAPPRLVHGCRGGRAARPAFIYHLGDSDPSGENAAEVIERELRGVCARRRDPFRAAGSDARSRSATGVCQAVRRRRSDYARGWLRQPPAVSSWTAIDPNRLRKLVVDAINRHMPKKLYTKLMKAEQDEQDEIRELVDQIS